MGRPSRYEIEKFANNAFAVANKRILIEHAEKQQQVLRQVSRNGNSGGYLPALIKWGAERLRETILAQADAYVDAFTESGMPADAQSKKTLETSSAQFAAGTISNILGQLDLTSKRTRKPMNGAAGSIEREIEKSRVSALAEGNLKLERQRLRAGEATTAPASARMPRLESPTQVGTASAPTDRAKRADANHESKVEEVMSDSAGDPLPAMDSNEIKNSTSKFGQAKRDARTMFDSIARKGLSICADAATYRRWLDDAEVNVRSTYLARKNPAWDGVLPAMDLATGREWLEPGEAKLLAEKRDYERNLKHLDVHSPVRKQYWLEWYARESAKGRKAKSPARMTTSRADAAASTRTLEDVENRTSSDRLIPALDFTLPTELTDRVSAATQDEIRREMLQVHVKLVNHDPEFNGCFENGMHLRALFNIIASKLSGCPDFDRLLEHAIPAMVAAIRDELRWFYPSGDGETLKGFFFVGPILDWRLRTSGAKSPISAAVTATDSPIASAHSSGAEAVAEHAAGPQAVVNPRRSPKEFVDDYRLRPPRRSYEKLAAQIGISKDTLYAITKETRWVSDENYKVVANACGCKPENLHPRDVPRPERRRT